MGGVAPPGTTVPDLVPPPPRWELVFKFIILVLIFVLLIIEFTFRLLFGFIPIFEITIKFLIIIIIIVIIIPEWRRLP